MVKMMFFLFFRQCPMDNGVKDEGDGATDNDDDNGDCARDNNVDDDDDDNGVS